MKPINELYSKELKISAPESYLSNLAPLLERFLKSFASQFYEEIFKRKVNRDLLPLLETDYIHIRTSPYDDDFYIVFIRRSELNSIEIQEVQNSNKLYLEKIMVECEFEKGEVIWGLKIGYQDLFSRDGEIYNIVIGYLKDHINEKL